MNVVNITFSINQYDSDGDCIDKGIFLHFDSRTNIKVCDNFSEFEKIIKQLDMIKEEIEENYENH